MLCFCRRHEVLKLGTSNSDMVAWKESAAECNSPFYNCGREKKG